MRPRKEREQLERSLEQARRRIADLEHEVERRSGRDPLTGLLDLATLRSRLDAEVERSRRHGRPLAVALVDVDGFHALNTRHGFAAGDELLRTTARVLGHCTRLNDLVSRTAADEFAVVMPETDGPDASQCVERLLLELEATGTNAASCLSASVGIAHYRRPQTTEELLAAARTALDIAREGGGGRAAVAHMGDDLAHPRQGSQLDAVTGLAEALLERDRYTGEHSESVVELAARVARSLALDDAEVERIRIAALLHDIGKVAIPDGLLNKPAPLSDDEWKLMREHPVIGERILRAIRGLGSVARIVRHEHERYDGQGYPDGLSGDEIPIGSRIILACDSYHAMTSDRPYRAAMGHAEAVAELSGNAGTQFDPMVTEALIGSLYVTRQAHPVAS